MGRWLSRVRRWLRPGEAERVKQARRAEASGDWERATQLYLKADAPADAARVLSMRASATLDPGERLKCLVLAQQYTPEEQRAEIDQTVAMLKLELTREGILFLSKAELRGLGDVLSRLNKSREAADAYGMAGDLEAQTNALVDAGAIEKLEAVFHADQSRQEAEQGRARALQQALDLDRLGRRRAALELIADQPEPLPPDLRELGRSIRERRCRGGLAVLELETGLLCCALGHRVTLGRGNANIVVPSPAVSRVHLEFANVDGVACVWDRSSSGTSLGGVALATQLSIERPLALTLGGEVSVHLEPEAQGLRLSLLDKTWLLPLGDLKLDFGVLRAGEAGWVELVPNRSVFLGGLHSHDKLELCRGDQVSLALNEPPVLKVVE